MASVAWGGVAEARRRWRRQLAAMSQAATEALLEACHLRPDMRILDVASGLGEPALPLASAVGPQGRVTATDPSPEMLAIIEELAAERGLSPLVCRVSQAESLPFPSSTFDLVTSRFGVMYFTDAERGAREMHRVLVTGGRVVLVAWGPWQDSELFQATLAVVARHLPSPPDIAANAQFRFADPEKLTALLRQAGFHNISAGFRDVPWCWPGTAEEAWQCVQETAAAFRSLFDAIPPERRAQVDADVLAAMRAWEVPGQVRFRARIVLASAEKG